MVTYIDEAEYTFTGTATTAVTTRIPSAVQLGDLLICGSGNVSSLASGSTMNNSWTKLQEVGIGGAGSDNCYFILAAKIATATEVSAAGNTVQIATQPSTDGNTNKTSQCLAYRGTYGTVATAIPSSNVKHESSPADQTIETNSVTPTDDNQWLASFFNMASGGNQSSASFSSSGYTFRGDAKIANGTTTTSCVSCYDSNGAVAVTSTQRSGTWSSTATRLNGAIAVIAGPNDKAGTETSTGSEGLASIAFNRTDAGSGADTQSLAVSFNKTDAGSGFEAQSLATTQTRTDTATGTDSQSIFELVAQKSGTETASGLEGTAFVAFSRSDTGSASESVSIVSISDWSDPAMGTTSDIQLSNFLVMGPANIYVADFGALEPLDTALTSDPDSAIWTDLGGILGGVNLNLSQKYETPDQPVQVVNNANSRLKRREFKAEADLAEPSVANFAYLLNGGTVATGAGWKSYLPPALDSGTPLTYRAVMIDGWAPGFNGSTPPRHKRRRVIMRKCLSVSDVVMGFYQDKQTVLPVSWVSHRVDGVIAPIRVIDEV